MMRNYLATLHADQALVNTVRYLVVPGNEWRITRCRGGTPAQTLSGFLDMLEEPCAIETTELERDRLHMWQQMKGVSTYEKEF